MYYRKRKFFRLPIIALFVFAGVLLSFYLPGLIFQDESHAQYLSHVYIFLAPFSLALFAAGFVVSSLVRNIRTVGKEEASGSGFPSVKTDLIITEGSDEGTREIDPVMNLEDRLDLYRRSAEKDPEMLPELAKRLLTLAIMYRGKDRKKEEQYRDEARIILSRRDYPNSPEAQEVRDLGKKLGI